MVLVFLVRRKKNEGENFFLKKNVSFPSEEENSGKVS